MDVDEIYHEIGESGPQQIKYGLILCLLKAYTPFLVLQYTFVARSSTFKCIRGKEHLSNKCFDNSVAQCTSIIHSESTIVSEWNLVCDRNWMSKATMSALMFGFLLGAFFLGNLADRIGRKSNLILTLVGVIVSNGVSAVTSEYLVYTTARFLVGFFVAGNILSVIVLISELVGCRYRGLYGLYIMGAFPVGLILLALLAHLIRDWRMLSVTVSILGIPFLLSHFYLIESPRWLINSNRTEEAKAALLTIAKGNGNSSSIKMINSIKNGSIVTRPNETLRDLLSRRRLLSVVYILCYNWFVNGATYYGLTLASGDIGTDLYTGFALSGFVEVPAVLLSYLAIQQIGRRLGLSISMLLSGTACLLIHFLTGSPFEYLATSCALFGKMCIAGSFKMAYIISGEFFATSIRNSGLGLLSGTARIGSILSPFIVMAGESVPGIQFTVFGLLGLTGGLLSLSLPETKDKPLPENVSEMLWDKSKKIDHTNI